MKFKTKLTEYAEYCVICGRPSERHHIFKGNKHRKLADEDLMIMPLCREHHTGNLSVHNTKEMNVLCEIAGQLAWEKDYYRRKLPETNTDEAREAFRKRYGISFL